MISLSQDIDNLYFEIDENGDGEQSQQVLLCQTFLWWQERFHGSNLN